jgi:hypothetical protein
MAELMVGGRTENIDQRRAGGGQILTIEEEVRCTDS